MASTLKAAMADRWSKLEKTPEPPPPPPLILEAEREASPEELPRGPKMVAKAVAPPWTARWFRVLAEELESPKRGGESFGLLASHPDGRTVRASWNSLTGFSGGFLEDPTGEPQARVNEGRALIQTLPGRKMRLVVVPQKLKAKELKELVADG